MIFEPGHEYSLPPRCWEVASPERNEQEAIDGLHACVKSSTYNPSAAIPALAAKDCPDPHWLSVHDSRGQQAKENKNADSISLSKSFGIRGQHITTDLQRTSKEIRAKLHSQWKSKEIHGETTDSTSAASIRLSKLFGIRGQQYFNLDSPWLSANDIRGSQDTVTEAQSNTLIQTNTVLVARMKSQNERELSTNFKSVLFYSLVQIALLIHIGATSFSEGAFAALPSHPEYYCVDPQPSVSEGEILELISALRNDRAFSAAAPTHPEKNIALATASKRDQRPQMIVESYPMSILIVESISASRSDGESISASRSEGDFSQLIVEFILLDIGISVELTQINLRLKEYRCDVITTANQASGMFCTRETRHATDTRSDAEGGKQLLPRRKHDQSYHESST